MTGHADHAPRVTDRGRVVGLVRQFEHVAFGRHFPDLPAAADPACESSPHNVLTPDDIDDLLLARESEHLEFKEARTNFHFEELVQYCAALANEGGGRVLFGVTDRVPRRVVGSTAFDVLDRVKLGLCERLGLRVDVFEVAHPSGRVLVFEVPGRPRGVPIAVKGAYWMRAGESLKPMTPDMLKRIFEEAEPDYTATPCPGATMAELDPAAIRVFRDAWIRKSGNGALAELSDARLLEDAELLMDGRLTHAALILFGTHGALGRYLANAEVVFEYRSSRATGPAQQREDFRAGFFLWFDQLWTTINLRNDLQHFQVGLFVFPVPTFHEAAVREAVLNAVAHRDYRSQASVWVRQYPRELEVDSPGGLPPGITLENILFRQFPRNRRLADAFQRCGLVERAGQGMNRIYEECIRNGKSLPEFGGTDDTQVAVHLPGTVRDPRLLRFLEEIGANDVAAFSTEHFLVLDLLHREQPLPPSLKEALRYLHDRKIVEAVGRGRGARYILSQRFHAFLGEKGSYTRKLGLDRDTNKALLLKHIRANASTGSRMEEFVQVLPSLTHDQIKALLREMSEGADIRCEGKTRAARWYPSAARSGGASA